MRLIFDCNVLISALLIKDSIPAKALLKAKSSTSDILLSNHVYAELIEVLMRKKFDRYLTKEIRILFLQEFKTLCTNVEIIKRLRICRDPKDDMYLELAVSGKADCIITGDEDLLELNTFNNKSIITPSEFLTHFE